MTDGDWSSVTDYNNPERPVLLWTIRIGKVFDGKVVLEAATMIRKNIGEQR